MVTAWPLRDAFAAYNTNGDESLQKQGVITAEPRVTVGSNARLPL